MRRMVASRGRAARTTPRRLGSHILWGLAIWLCAGCPRPAPPEIAAPVSAVDAVALDVAAALEAGDGDALFALFHPTMQQAVPLEAARELVAGVRQAAGAFHGVTSTSRSGTYRLDGTRDDLTLALHLAPDGTVGGLSITAADTPEPAVQRVAKPLSLPFDGSWYVFWGGDTLMDNQHVSTPNQRRAADLMIVDEAGSTHTGAGTSNADYYVYRQEVLAAAGGVVTTVVDGVPDNRPGSLNPYAAVGNMVMVSHAPDEYAVYAHLVPGSVRVAAGDRVERGQVLGLCGNSGNSSEPHLHFHVQDTRALQDGTGLLPVFGDVVVVRQGVEAWMLAYEFLRGDVVSPQPARPAE